MLSPADLQSMRVMVATPCYASGAMSQYCVSMVHLAAECIKLGLPIRFEMHAESLITRGRNKLVAKFLADQSCTHLFFIDADVGFSSEAFFRLLLADRDVVAGVYPLKQFNWPKDGLPNGITEKEFEDRYTPYPFNPLPTGSLSVDSQGFAEVSEAPTGFMCIKRSVLDQLRASYPGLQYVGESPEEHWLFFDTMVDPQTRRYLSEDYAFCRRWRDSGGKVFIDIKSKLSHQGQHVWRGDLKAHLDASYRPK